MELEKFLGNIIDWNKIPPRILFALTVICGVFVFGGDDLLKYLGLAAIQSRYRPFFGFGFLLFGALFLSYPIATMWKQFSEWLKRESNRRKQEKIYKEWLKRLTPRQKEILRRFVKNQTRSVQLDYTDGAVNELVNAGIIYLPTEISIFQRRPRADNGLYTSYNIHPWVYEYLKEHPEMLS